MEARTLGLAWLCDPAGLIRQVVCDELQPGEAGAAGQSFVELVDVDSRDKAANLLTELRLHGAAFGWEMNVPHHGQLMMLLFSGTVQPDGLLIVAARNRTGLAELCDDLMRINNEQFNSLRAAEKTRAAAQILTDHALYDELTRLNNDLIVLQRELAKKNAELEHLDQQKNHLLGMAAHDLRNPLSVIMSYSELLMAEASAEHADFARTIYRSSEFMLRLINDLLDVAAIESGQVRLDLQPIDLPALVRHNIELNQRLANRKHITLSWTAPQILPLFLADVVKLEQVLNNLISNAIKFSHPHSTVEVEVLIKAERVVLAVHDHGQGIPAAELEKLFRAYSRTSVTSTAGEPSIGLGLAITRKIVAAHGGDLWVDSIFGQGTTFYVALPLNNLLAL